MHIKPPIVILFFFLISLQIACDKNNKGANTQSAADTLLVSKEYIRAMPPGQKISAMFLNLHNPSLNNYSLIAIEGDVSEHLELHQHKNIDGIMQMGQVDKIDIPAQKNTSLSPGGYHVMLINLKDDLKIGQEVEVKLMFADSSSMIIKPVVKPVDVTN